MSDAPLPRQHAASEPAADLRPAAAWQFGPFLLQPGHGLWRGGQPLPLGRRALDLLGALAQAGGAVVSKAQLFQAAWPGIVVVENALHQHMRALRLALGDQAALVQNVPGRGYRLAVPAGTVQRLPAGTADAAGPLAKVGFMSAPDHDGRPGPVPGAHDGPAPAPAPHAGPEPALAPHDGSESALASGAGPATAPAPRAVRLLPGLDEPAWPALPGQPVWPLLGREALLAEVLAALAAGCCVTLVGASGFGKTRLAQAVAADRAAAGQGVAWCGLAGLDSAADLVPALARAVGLPGTAYTLQAVARRLGRRPLLLVLDNCEHLLQACVAALQQLLVACPGLAVLATSQRPLGLATERRVPVGPLGLPAADAALPAVLKAAPAMQLLLQRLHDGGGGAVSAQDLQHAAALCRRLDGNPLALELAATRVAVLGWAATRAGLEHSLALLAGGRAGSLPRHRSLDAAIAWSCGLLSPRLRDAWQALSVFRGGCTPEAAAEVLGLRGAAAVPQALELLAALCEHSLLWRDPAAAAPRFCMHEAPRMHAQARLQRSAQAEAVARRHALCIAGVVEQAERDWETLPDAAWLARYGPEFDNLVVATDWALARAAGPAPSARRQPSAAKPPGDPEPALRLLGAGIALWRARGAMDRLRSHLQHPALPQASAPLALLQARALALHHESADSAQLDVAARQALAATGPDGHPVMLARLWLCLATVGARRCDWALQDDALARAEALLQGQPRGRTWGAWCQARGWAWQMRDRLPQAQALVEQARAVWGACGAWLDETRALAHVADLMLAQGDVAGAIANGQAAADRLEGSWHPEVLGRVLANLGAAHAAAGQHAQAARLLLRGLIELRGLDFGWWVFDHLSALAVAEGRLHDAARWLGHADDGYRRHRNGRRLHNEARVVEATLQRLRAQLAPEQLAALLDEGARCSEAMLLHALAQQPLAGCSLRPAAA